MLFSETEGIYVNFDGKEYGMEAGLLAVTPDCSCEFRLCWEHEYPDCDECGPEYGPCECQVEDTMILIPGSELDLALAEAGGLTHVERDVAYLPEAPYGVLKSFDQIPNKWDKVLWNGKITNPRTLDLVPQLGVCEMPDRIDVGGIKYIDMRERRMTTRELKFIIGDDRLLGDKLVAPEEAPEYTVFVWTINTVFGQLSKGVWVML